MVIIGARTSFAMARAAVAQRLAAQQCLAKKVRSLAQQSGQDVRAPLVQPNYRTSIKRFT